MTKTGTNQSGATRKRQAACPTSEAPVKFRFRGGSKSSVHATDSSVFSAHVFFFVCL